MNKIIGFVVKAVGNTVLFFSSLFLVVWLIAWTLNAVHGTHFDMSQLKDLYIWMAGQLNATHLINSGLNTPIPWRKTDGGNQ